MSHAATESNSINRNEVAVRRHVTTLTMIVLALLTGSGVTRAQNDERRWLIFAEHVSDRPKRIEPVVPGLPSGWKRDGRAAP